ncbi:MAG: TetR/AcrR family transcriptional regulator [Pseudomonadota bacterium]|nr:TetR/AcrR family transcriptional regulator [Pseudomonadota bacterium]
MNREAGDKGRQSRAEGKAATRRQLLEAARTEFMSVGYQGATLDDIAARAGFTKGALYWHFTNKQAIFLALIADSIDANLATLAALVEPDAPADRIRKRMGEWIDGIDERETLPQFGVELEIQARRNASFRAIHQAMIAKHEAALGAFLTRYFEVAEIEPLMPVSMLASTLITIFKGFALSRRNRPDAAVTSAAAARLLMGLPLK